MSDAIPPSQDPAVRLSIRVVNHDLTLTDLIRGTLRDLPYEVTTTYRAPPEIDEIAAARPALLVIDLIFLQVSRWQLLARLRATPEIRSIPVLLVSDNEDLLRQARADEEQFGGNGYLQMPLDPDEFRATVRELVESRPMRP